MWRRRANHLVGAEQIGANLLGDVFIREPLRSAKETVASLVDDDVDLPEPRESFVPNVSNLERIDDVQMSKLQRIAEVFLETTCCVQLANRSGDAVSLCDELACHVAAKSTVYSRNKPRARDHYSLPSKRAKNRTQGRRSIFEATTNTLKSSASLSEDPLDRSRRVIAVGKVVVQS